MFGSSINPAAVACVLGRQLSCFSCHRTLPDARIINFFYSERLEMPILAIH